jgi:hypothetical protein
MVSLRRSRFYMTLSILNLNYVYSVTDFCTVLGSVWIPHAKL